MAYFEPSNENDPAGIGSGIETSVDGQHRTRDI